MSLPERISRLEVKVEDLESEAQRTRRRLHELETDRATIRLLGREVRGVLRGTERVAEVAAQKAVSLHFETRQQTRRENWSYRLRWISAGAAVSGGIAGLVIALLH